MIEKAEIENIVKESIKGTELFLAGVKVSASNRIVVMVDTKTGITIDECALLHRQIESRLNRDKEDFELLVSSPGVDQPFQVVEQYEKNEGRMVEVLENDGIKHSGILQNVTKGGFELLTEKKIKGKGKEQKLLSFNFEQVKATRELLIIK
jgi:ribosome maturation factor RimP